GVPHHSARRYIARLIESGLRVAICEQVETPGAGPGIVRRDVIRVITPGTILDEEILGPQQNNFLAAVHQAGSPHGSGDHADPALAAALLDASTGEFSCLEARDAFELAAQLAAHEPREILVAADAQGKALAESLLTLLPGRPCVAQTEPAAF